MASRPSLLSVPFALGFAANFLHSFGFFSYLHLPGLLQAWGEDELSIGLVMASASAAGVACRPIVGRAVDERGRRVVLIAGSLLHLATTIAYLTISVVGPWLIAIRLVHGIAIAMLFTVLFTIAADVVPPSRRTEGIAIYGLSGILPMSLAGLVGDSVLERGSYTDLFWVVIGSTALAVIVGLGLRESRTSPPKQQGPGFFATVGRRPLRPLWFVGLGFALTIAAYFTFVKTFVIAAGIGSVGSFFTAYTVVAIVLRIGLGWLPDRLGLRRALVPAMAAVVAALVLLATATTDAHVIAAGVLAGAGHAWVFPILSSLVVSRASDEERGSALAAFTAVFDVGLLVGGPMYGAVLRSSDYHTTFLLAAGISVAAVLVYLPWDVAATASDESA